MEITKTIILMIILYGIMCMLIGLTYRETKTVYVTEIKEKIITETITEIERCESLSFDFGDPLMFHIIYQLVQNHEYVKDVYDCTQFSSDGYDWLEALGYDPVLCRGDMNINGEWISHRWLKLNNVVVETTVGRFIDPRDYEENYIEKRCWKK